ncbi:MAG: hypothetical protein OEW39_11460 [Deltaproteobacteria bacterium]|nr:hypothetical protein [Deltaproteobacteria bacterium]
MPRTVQWFVRAALLHLLAAVVLGLLMQVDLWRGTFGFSPYLRVMHTHLALMGGVVQMILGVAMWMFPQTQPPSRRLPFREGWAFTAFALFNGGLWGRFLFESLHRSGAGDVFGGLTVLTTGMQLAGMGIVAAHLWRLRPHRRDQGTD